MIEWFQNTFQGWAKPVWGDLPSWFWISLSIVIIWSFIWKGLALWRAARRGEKAWFVALLVINTVGILEILYLYVFSRKDNTQV